MVLERAGARLIVADAFGGRLAVIDPKQGTLKSIRSLPAHNIRGLAEAPDGRTLVVAHQVLHRLARTSFEDVHWGSLLNNALRVVLLDQLLASDPGADLLRGSRQLDLGDPGNGAGDPAAARLRRDGHLVVVLAGVDAIRIGTDPARLPVRTGVGRRPTAPAPAPTPARSTLPTHSTTPSPSSTCPPVCSARRSRLAPPASRLPPSAARVCSLMPACRTTAG